MRFPNGRLDEGAAAARRDDDYDDDDDDDDDDHIGVVDAEYVSEYNRAYGGYAAAAATSAYNTPRAGRFDPRCDVLVSRALPMCDHLVCCILG